MRAVQAAGLHIDGKRAQWQLKSSGFKLTSKSILFNQVQRMFKYRLTEAGHCVLVKKNSQGYKNLFVKALTYCKFVSTRVSLEVAERF